MVLFVFRQPKICGDAPEKDDEISEEEFEEAEDQYA